MRLCVILLFAMHISFLVSMEKNDSPQETTSSGKVGDLIIWHAHNGTSSTPVSLMRILSTQASLPLVKLIAGKDCINNYDRAGFPPLYYILKQRKFDSAKYLLLNKGDINIKVINKAYCYAQSLYPPLLLHFTEERNSSDIVEWLLLNGAKIHARDDVGNTALHYACLANHTQNVNILCDYGADVNKTNNAGSTPLHKALNGSNDDALETVIYLIEHGALLNIKNKYEVEPLDMLQRKDENRKIRSYLEWENQKSFSDSEEKKSFECPEAARDILLKMAGKGNNIAQKLYKRELGIKKFGSNKIKKLP